MNTYIISRFAAYQQSLMSHYGGGSGLPSSSIGAERETFVREFLSRIFPQKYRFGTGAITDVQNNISGQVDVVIELPFEPSFPMPSTDVRLYPAEAVGAVMEIKSDLTSQWDEAIRTTKKLRELKRNLQIRMSMGGGATPLDQIPIYWVGYKGHAKIDTLKTRLANIPADSRPDGALVIESGCFHKTDGSVTATGAGGLLALIACINAEMSRVISATSNLFQYATP